MKRMMTLKLKERPHAHGRPYKHLYIQSQENGYCLCIENDDARGDSSEESIELTPKQIVQLLTYLTRSMWFHV